jgi:hypothetical protein
MMRESESDLEFDPMAVEAPVAFQEGQASPVTPVLERALLPWLRWDLEKTLWALLLVVALLSRVIGLGDRAMSHDESLHTVYSY